MKPPLPHRLPCELLWVRPVTPPPAEVMVRVVVALRGRVPDSVSIPLIRHWMREITTRGAA